MEDLNKLKEALKLLGNAEQLINEARQVNKFLDQSYGHPLQIGIQDLNRLSSTLKKLVETEKIDGEKKPENMVPALRSLDGTDDSYFPQSLKDWITAVLKTDKSSTDDQLIRQFVERGIKEQVAINIVLSERERWNAGDSQYQIDFRDYEPDDDRIFTASDMFDFAYEISQEAMGAAFSGKKSIDGQPLAEYINIQLDQESGDGNSRTWIPKSEWPKAGIEPVNHQGRNKRKTGIKSQRKGGKRKR